MPDLAAAQPDVGAIRARPFRKDACHPGHDLLGRVRLGDAFGEVREHLIGSGALAVDETVGHVLDTLAHRLESDRHDRGRKDRQRKVRFAAASDQGTNANRNTDVDGGDERGQRSVDQRPADDDVDVVKAVLEDGDSGCPGNRHAEAEGDHDVGEAVEKPEMNAPATCRPTVVVALTITA